MTTDDDTRKATAVLVQGRYAAAQSRRKKEPNPKGKAMTRIESSCLFRGEMFSEDMSSTHMEESTADASPSDVLSSALDMLDISSVGGGSNEKQTSSSVIRPRRSSPPVTARRTSPINARDAVISFPAKVVALHHVSTSTSKSTTIQINNNIGTHAANITKPKLVRLSSTDSCSTTTTVSTAASFASSTTTSSTLSSPSNSPIASPKRSIFQSYWEKTKTTATTISCPHVPHVSSGDSMSDHTSHSTQPSNKADAQPTTPSTPRSATVTLPEGYQLTSSTTTAGTSASPKRSIFGDRAMETAKRSSLPDLPSIAATLITESDYTACGTYADYHRVHHVRKTSSTDHLVRVRKSCLRRVSLYSGSGELRKSASALSTASTAGGDVTANTTSRPRASTLPTPSSPVVQFDPQVRVYEFHRTAEEPQGGGGSNDWSHLFA